ncbi:MAG: hypothetical protein JJ864_01070 [Rhizobiaceae bacterium]|nr:hypothetical protein [Rhizobiaceae bacterium]
MADPGKRTPTGSVAAAAAALWWIIATASAAHAAERYAIDTPAPVSMLLNVGNSVFAVLRDGTTYRLRRCEARVVCLAPAQVSGLPPKAPHGGLPDGRIASASSGDIRQAWYGRPTTRYGHAVLGDGIEAGSLVARDAVGQLHELVLPDTHVFEDITPRIADLDGDGRNEIVTIRSSLKRGGAIAVYGLRDGVLELLDASAEIGRSRRWLNVAGIASYHGAGRPVVAWVETPHIGGTLKLATFENGKLKRFGSNRSGFSNHFIGSREQQLSATGDFTRDGRLDLALPGADRRSLVIVSTGAVTRTRLPGRVATALSNVGGAIVTADDNGTLLAVIP